MTQEYLKSILDYNPDTGEFRWKRSKIRAVKGAMAGYFRRDGYLEIHIDTKRCLGHRLAFLFMLGRWPNHLVDHINRDPSDNRWCNLRESNYAQNGANSRVRKTNEASPFRGVRKHGRRFNARITVNKKTVFLGSFKTSLDAAKAYDTAAKKYHGEFAQLNFKESEEICEGF